MRIKRLFIAMMVGLTLIASVPVNAIDNEMLNVYSQNDILFYDPTTCRGNSGTPDYDNLIVGKSSSERLKEVVETYGEMAMDMQRKWGTPWEVVFAQMVMESSVGTAGVAVSIWEENHYYNWLGITGKGGKNSVGVAYNSGRDWAQYASIENMIKDWAGEYIARNGYYDSAFKNNLDPNNYNLRGFLNDFIMVYAPPSDGNDVSGYINIVESYINGTIADVRAEKNWLSSAELAQQEKIPIGGENSLKSGGDSDGEEGVSGCELLRSSPDYNGANYQAKLANLHDYNQGGGTFAGWPMCSSDGRTIKQSGCGIMSLYAAWYMFSGEGYNDESVFREFLAATRADGYNACTASSASSFGSNLNAYTEMSGEMLFNYTSSYIDHWDDMVAALKEGKKLVIYVGSDAYGTSFTNGGHYMMLDHYNEEKGMIYLFDPSMWSGKYSSGAAGNNPIAGSGVELVTDNVEDGIYVDHNAMTNKVRPAHALALTYDGCYGDGVSVCRSTSNGLVDGGMTYEQAVEFIKPYANEAAKESFGDYGDGTTNGTVIGKGKVYNVGCSHGTLNNCVAFSQWFLNNYTDLGPAIGTTNGWWYVDMLVNDISNKLVDGGKVPKAYAIFSTISYNHTGVVLGVNKEKNEVYTGEASCGFLHPPTVKIKSLDEMTNGDYKYAYTDGKLKKDEFIK